MRFAQAPPPPPQKYPAASIPLFTGARMMLTPPLSPDQQALLGHMQSLRHGVLASDSASTQLECAILLIDLYEAILERNGILIYEDQKRVVEH